jgi:holo-[acyl-carrier-protein] synthase
MIYGIGTDICDVRRIRASLEKHGERFARKVLADGELATWKARSERWPERGIRYMATRFSAKEAFSKAMGLGMVMPMTWRIASHQPAQRPAHGLHGELKEWFEKPNLRPTCPSPMNPTTPPATVVEKANGWPPVRNSSAGRDLHRS